MQLILKSFELQLKHTFRISRESYSTQPSLIVELKDGPYSGYGEATSNPFYGISIQKMIDDLNKIKPFIEQTSSITPELFWKKMHTHLKKNRFALCALDMAFNDLFAKKKNKKLYELWKLSPKNKPLTNYTIGIDTIEKMVSKMKETPWPIYKIKLGTKEDLKIVTELRKHTNAIFRVDANCGWNAKETINNAIELKKLGVEFIEQPLPIDQWDAQKLVFQESVLPIIADESCQIEEDVEKCLDHFHGVNIKLVKCGGLTPAKRMLKKARKLKLKTMVGCMTESTVGISAIAQLLPLLDFVDMDGSLLLKEDIATGISIKSGVVSYNKTVNGTGVTLI